MKHVRWIMAAAVLAVFLLPGCQWDSRPLHERIAEGMFHAQNDPQWEYVTGKYGEEDFTLNTEDYVGGIYSSRFDIWMKLYWDEEEKTYRDSYAVYLRQGELIALLDEAFGEILGEDDCRIYALPYLWCPSGFGRDTTARELLEASEITDDILVQTAVFTTKDPAGREADWQAVREAVQSRGWSLQVDFYYVPEEHLALIPENKNGNPYESMTVLDRAFYYCRATAHVRPDSFKWMFEDGWQEGEAE